MGRITIVGGGFAGFWAGVAAARVLDGRHEVCLVSRSPTLVMRPRLYEADPASLGINIRPLLDSVGVRLVEAEAVSLDLYEGAVHLATGSPVPFDRVVVTTGSVLSLPDVDGVDCAFSIDTQAAAIELDRALAEIAMSGEPPSIAVIGAGPTGIELALELRDRIDLHAAGRGNDAHILLLDSSEVVGSELGAGPRPAIEAALDEARIEVRLGARIRHIESDHILLDSGHRFDVHATVLATGMVADGFTRNIPGDRDSFGRILVAPDLSAPEAPAVFVAGDAAAADTGDGHLALQSCQHALRMGRFAGENAARDLLGQPTLPYRQRRYVTCVDLGRSGAVQTTGWDREVVATGPEAGTVKRHINEVVIYPPT
ncbi:MAG: FAD-dependent oxidoreductase, partial [Actinomycetia bacterium]|nr:FAD-dependent oxidoreductase [Actinomycetes bacterium]